jgi:hypothetical protein
MQPWGTSEAAARRMVKLRKQREREKEEDIQ